MDLYKQKKPLGVKFENSLNCPTLSIQPISASTISPAKDEISAWHFSRPDTSCLAIRLMIADPTMTPLAKGFKLIAWSAVLIPKPTQIGVSVLSFSHARRSVNSGGKTLRSPVDSGYGDVIDKPG